MASSSKKMKKSYDDNRKYLESWEREFPWITSVTSKDTRLAFCKLCRKSLQPHQGTLTKHAQGTQHKRVVNSVSTSHMLNVTTKPKLTEEVKRAELEVALATCCHCSIVAIDHLGEVRRKNGKGSPLENIKLHRTKCTA